MGTLGVEAFQELERMAAEESIERVTDKERPFRMIYRLKSAAASLD